MESNKKISEARYRANKKYNDKSYKKLQALIKPNDYDMIDKFCKDNNISKAKFVVAACRYCIDNNIDVTDDKDK